jgi:threonine dehydratase
VKVTQTRGHGANVILHGENVDEALAFAHDMAEAQGLTIVHPFNDPQIIAGQGTVALEMLEDAPDIDLLIVPIGGGGLISGCATVAKAAGGIEVIGVEAELYPSMYNMMKGTSLPCAGDTLAEGIAVKEPGSVTSEIVSRLVDDIVLVPERYLEEAVSLLLQIEKTVAEGAGAAGLAAMLAYPERFAGRTVGIVLCGGNIDTRLLANVLLRDLARSGRLARLRIKLQDRPGALYHVARIFDQEQVNIIEVYHQRIFSSLPAKGLITDIECETRDAAHLEALMAALAREGYDAVPVELA